MQKLGKKKLKGVNPEVLEGKVYATKPDLMAYLGYSPTNKTSFSRLKKKNMLPPFIFIGRYLFNVEAIKRFYSETLPKKQKVKPSFLVS